jgi:eukaryotic-like serine/threonine-protein kinase
MKNAVKSRGFKKKQIFVFIILIIVVIAGVSLLIIQADSLFKRSAQELILAKSKMEMLFIPAGRFLMGSDNSDRNQRPPHKVFLDTFWIDQTEVTNAQYLLCVKEGACVSPHESDYFRDTKNDNHPVIYISWAEAQTFCTWAGKRLPTEAEWEKAARGDDARIYPWGNQKPNSSLLNYFDTVHGTTEVGKYPSGASQYGVMDMAGNVWEWTSDWYDPDYYKISPMRNPKGPINGTRKVLRGGSWFSLTELIVRNAFRKASSPETRNYSIGFRCVWDG